MKSRRFLSLFLLLTLLVSLFAAPTAQAAEDPAVRAKAALLVDEGSGAILYAKNEHEQLYPASLTKIMTCLLVLEAVDSGKLTMDQEITAPAEAFRDLDADGSSAGIKIGETMTVENLLYCMMVVSANEVCNIFAVTIAGSVSDFVDRMNQRAAELGCKNTHFANAIGLQDARHYTSAWDLYLITKQALTHKEFMTVCDTADVYIPATNLSEQRHLYTTNYLLSSFRALGYMDKDAHGIKTGSTSDAGHCLVSSASKNGLNVLSVVLGAEKVVKADGKSDVQSFSETSRLFDWAFASFTYQTVLTPEVLLKSVPVELSREADSVALHTTKDLVALMPKDIAPEEMERTVTLKAESVKAPVKAGDVLGTVELSYDGTVYATAELVAYSDVSASKLLTFWDNVKLFFSRTAVKVVCVVLAILIVALAVWKFTVGRRRYRYGHSVSRGRTGYRGRRRRG